MKVRKKEKDIYYGYELLVPLLMPAISPLIQYYSNNLYMRIIDLYTKYDTFMQNLMQKTIDYLKYLDSAEKGISIVNGFLTFATLLFQLLIGLCKYVFIVMGRLIMAENRNAEIITKVDLANAVIWTTFLCIIFGFIIYALIVFHQFLTGEIRSRIFNRSVSETHLFDVSRLKMYIITGILLFPFSVLSIFPIMAYEIAMRILRPMHDAQPVTPVKENEKQSIIAERKQKITVPTNGKQNAIARNSKQKRKNIAISNTKDTEILEMDDFIGREKAAEEIRTKVEKYKIYFSKAKKADYPNAPKIRKPLLKIPAFHIVITGNPGTGKTEFARAIARYMMRMGVIENDHTVEIARQDIVNSHIGDAKNNLLRYISEAQGGVLFIDEAYNLIGDTNDINQDIIGVLLRELDRPDCNFILIMAGYKYEMTQFINQNPGLKRRIGITLDFADYTEEQLFKIFMKMAGNKYEFTNDAIEAVKHKIHMMYQQKDSTFGNAAAMKKLLEEDIISNMFRNHNYPKHDGTFCVTVDDIWSIEEKAVRTASIDEVLKDLNNYVGLDSLKDILRQIYDSVTVNQLKMEAPSSNIIERESHHCLFLGNPGTGKTTAARLLGEALYKMGLISTPKVVEATRPDLIGQHVGDTEAKTRAKLQEARGGILFIDEAYQLCKKDDSPNDFGEKALGTILADMEDNRFSFVLIMAGYEDEMREMLECNKGLEQRFKYTVKFPDYTDSEMVDIFKSICRKNNLSLSDAAKVMLPEKIAELRKSSGFANARSVRNYFSEVKSRQNTRIVGILKSEGKDVAMKKMRKIEKVDL